MLRSRENLHVIYILLFLEAAFFLLQMQDPERYRAMFAFIPERFFAGEVWRLITYQFTQGSALGLFFALLILYIMGNALEEEWGTVDFVAFWAISVLASAAVGVMFGFPLIGSFFLTYSLLFAYALTYPEMTFYLFFVLPVKVKWLAWIALAFLLIGLIRLSPTSFAAAGGAAASLLFFWFRHGRGARPRILPVRPKASFHERPPISASDENLADRNLAMFDEVEAVLATGDPAAREELIRKIEPHIQPGVNICPPPDYKPRNEDRYCIRCEGFPECSVRFIRLKAGDETPAADSAR